MSTTSTSSTVSKKFVEDGFAMLNAGDLTAFFALYSDDVRNPSMANLGLPTNKQGFQSFVNGFYAAFSATSFVPKTILCDGDTTMFRWVFQGKHTGTFNGVAPTGRPIEIDCFTTFRLGPDGKVIQQHDLGDLATLMRLIA